MSFTVCEIRHYTLTVILLILDLMWLPGGMLFHFYHLVRFNWRFYSLFTLIIFPSPHAFE